MMRRARHLLATAPQSCGNNYDAEQVWVADNGGPTGVGTSGAKAASCAANK
jgi:hypothetical protein